MIGKREDAADGGIATRSFGRSGVELSEFGFGGAGGFVMSERAVAEAAVDTAWAAGVRYYDTAPFYGLGLSERRMGDCLRQYRRDAFVLSTKVGRLLRPGASEQSPPRTAPGQPPLGIRLDYSHDGVMRSVEDSLQRLGLDRIDIAWLHDISPFWLGDRYEACFRETMEGGYKALERLRAEGTIRAFGVGVKDPEICVRFARAGDFDGFMLAGAYTLLNQTGLDELLPLCARRGLGIVHAAAFNSGILATGARPGATYYYKEAPQEIMERTRRIEAICAAHEVALPAAALNFPLRHPAVASVVSGHSSPQEVKANIRHYRARPPEAFWSALADAGLIPRAAAEGMGQGGGAS